MRGGPAPGLNSVIAAATIRARLQGVDVLGLRDGFEWIMQGDIDHITPLTIEGVSRIHFRGGSHIGIARATLESGAPNASVAAAAQRLATDHDRGRRTASA